MAPEIALGLGIFAAVIALPLVRVANPLTALLALGWGYLRLDGWTNGRFTRWVCVLAAAIVGLAGLGWLTSN